MLVKKGIEKFEGVDPALVKIITQAAEKSPDKIQITEGLRTLARQIELKEAGKSKTLKSKHITGKAVDVMINEDFQNFNLYTRFATIVKREALENGVTVIWGGDWPKFRDGVHFELV